MRNKILSLFFFTFFLYSQILPTIPSNVFRVSIGRMNAKEHWNLKTQNFNLNGVGRRYFNNLHHNDNLRFTSNFDLYQSGSVILDSANTVESWLIKFNQENDFELPTFGKQEIDTNSNISINGLFDEKREKTFSGKKIKIDYGMSDEITISVSFALIEKYNIRQTFSNYSIGKAEGVQELIDYHSNAKNELKTFINSNTYNNLNRGLRDTLSLIFDSYYRNNGDYSVNWVFHSGNDPINNLLIDDGFKPQEINKDSVSLSDLVAFYYPNNKKGKGVDDIQIGATILLAGEPAWKTGKKTNTFYGLIQLSIPYASTISPFLKKRELQFTEANIGSGVPRWSIGFLSEWNVKSKKNTRMFLASEVQFSTKATLNTPIQLFSGEHTHPDSILANIGNTYKYDLGTGFIIKTGGEMEVLQNRYLIHSELYFMSKSKDQYISKSNSWDNWMESHDGYSSTYQFLDVSAEFWILNSISKNRIGPISFDFYSGFKNNIMAKNIYSGWNVYSGITTYFQGW